MCPRALAFSLLTVLCVQLVSSKSSSEQLSIMWCKKYLLVNIMHRRSWGVRLVVTTVGSHADEEGGVCTEWIWESRAIQPARQSTWNGRIVQTGLVKGMHTSDVSYGACYLHIHVLPGSGLMCSCDSGITTSEAPRGKLYPSSLPSVIQTASTLSTFKNRLNTRFFFPSYSVAWCLST